MNLHGNLDCEARWAQVALPGPVQRRISLYAALFAACAPDPGEEPHRLWVPAPVDPARLRPHPGWTPPEPCTGDTTGPVDLAWASPAEAFSQLFKAAAAVEFIHGGNDRSALGLCAGVFNGFPERFIWNINCCFHASIIP